MCSDAAITIIEAPISGARYQELVAPLVNPATADQPGARPHIYVLSLLA